MISCKIYLPILCQLLAILIRPVTSNPTKEIFQIIDDLRTSIDTLLEQQEDTEEIIEEMQKQHSKTKNGLAILGARLHKLQYRIHWTEKELQNCTKNSKRDRRVIKGFQIAKAKRIFETRAAQDELKKVEDAIAQTSLQNTMKIKRLITSTPPPQPIVAPAAVAPAPGRTISISLQLSKNQTKTKVVYNITNNKGVQFSIVKTKTTTNITYLDTPTLHTLSTKLPTPLYLTSSVHNGKGSIYIIGGNGPETYSTYSNSILRFSILSHNIERVATLPTTVHSATAVWDGNGVLIFGGESRGPPSAQVYGYIPGVNRTLEAGLLPQANRYSSAVAIREGEALIFGGRFNGDRIVNYSRGGLHIELLEQRLPVEIWAASSILVNSSVYLFGAWLNEDCWDGIIKYDVDTGESTILQETLPVALWSSVAVYNGKYVYILGEFCNKDKSGVVRFDPETYEANIVRVEGYPKKFREGSTVYVKGQNKAYIFGGKDDKGPRNEIMYLQF